MPNYFSQNCNWPFQLPNQQTRVLALVAATDLSATPVSVRAHSVRLILFCLRLLPECASLLLLACLAPQIANVQLAIVMLWSCAQRIKLVFLAPAAINAALFHSNITPQRHTTINFNALRLDSARATIWLLASPQLLPTTGLTNSTPQVVYLVIVLLQAQPPKGYA